MLEGVLGRGRSAAAGPARRKSLVTAPRLPACIMRHAYQNAGWPCLRHEVRSAPRLGSKVDDECVMKAVHDHRATALDTAVLIAVLRSYKRSRDIKMTPIAYALPLTTADSN